MLRLTHLSTWNVHFWENIHEKHCFTQNVMIHIISTWFFSINKPVILMCSITLYWSLLTTGSSMWLGMLRRFRQSWVSVQWCQVLYLNPWTSYLTLLSLNSLNYSEIVLPTLKVFARIKLENACEVCGIVSDT